MNQQKANIFIVGLIALVALGTSISNTFRGVGTERNASTLSKIVGAKQMDVCVAEWPPASIKDPKTGEYSGHDIDLYKAIAKEIGATVVFHDTTFGNMPAAIQSGICDMGTSLFVTPGRSAAVNFTRPILYSGVSALVRKGDTRFSSVQDINRKGVRVATATGEAGDIYAKAQLTEATRIPVDVDAADLSRFALEVTSRRADIAIADSNTIVRFAAAHPETKAIFVNNPLQLSPDAFPLRAGDEALRAFVDNAILALQVSGEWNAILGRYNAHWLQPVVQYHLQ